MARGALAGALVAQMAFKTLFKDVKRALEAAWKELQVGSSASVWFVSQGVWGALDDVLGSRSSHLGGGEFKATD